MNALKKMAAERGAYIAVVTLFLIGATVLSTILHKDSDYAAGLTKPDENIPSTEAESAQNIEEPDYSYERFTMTFTGSINAGSMLGSSSYGTLGGLYDEKGGGYFLEDITDITKKDDMTLSFLSSVFSDSEELSARDKSGESEIGWYKAPRKTPISSPSEELTRCLSNAPEQRITVLTDIPTQKRLSMSAVSGGETPERRYILPIQAE